MNIDEYDIIKGLAGLVIALLVWIALREFHRIGKHGMRIAALERESVNREELHQKLEEGQRERLRLHAENSAKLDEIIQTTNAINSHAISLATIDVRLKAVEVYQTYLSDWKHKVVDPYVPRAIDEHERRLARLEQ